LPDAEAAQNRLTLPDAEAAQNRLTLPDAEAAQNRLTLPDAEAAQNRLTLSDLTVRNTCKVFQTPLGNAVSEEDKDLREQYQKKF
jgi:hypothetical protein